MAAGGGIDPIHQFHIAPIVELKPFGLDLSFTNTSLWMVIVLAVVSAIMIYGSSQRSVVPGRLQSLAEMTYEFVASTMTGVMGKEGLKFFPFVFSLFVFILIGNFYGMVPYFFTFTSHIIVTFALSMLVMTVVVAYGFIKNGPRFLKLFVPAGVPGYIIPIVTPIEVISFLSRPISLSVRLFGNMLAGHITLKVFTGFVVSLGSLGFLGVLGASLPLIMGVAITALEFMVSAVQAYVFAVLTSMYLNDAIHPSH